VPVAAQNLIIVLRCASYQRHQPTSSADPVSRPHQPTSSADPIVTSKWCWLYRNIARRTRCWQRLLTKAIH